MTSDVSVTIHGSRGSYPVCGQGFTRYGGNTSCVSFRSGQREIIFDAGSGIIEYGRKLVRESFESGRALQTSIFISHTHFDHLLGLPYFSPVYIADATLHIFGPRFGSVSSFEDTIHALIRSPFYPVALNEMTALKHFYDMGEAERVYFLYDQEHPVVARASHPDHQHLIPDPDQVEIEVHCLRGYNHPKSGVNMYKVISRGKTFVYATDTEGYVHGDRRLAEFARGADLIVHDAMYTEAHYTSMPSPTQGYGHSTVSIAAELARQAGVRRLCLFHHDPKSTDDDLDAIDALGKSLFPESFAARDGLTIAL
ncbi:MBL fold metallo-hydrolase [Lujinxingia litoralis]|uniref:MBL fold metallo-hydrolase n=1 Tax=Lujinxingia litoralis TaxID=2211119 RepID=A0A328C8R1_9DELT|nr:MBL fold metallo-hydrolase [Lujinxingia litoralis]RAL23552.1 MBL fold metallo-hydrolase [Lujinxingia litoralis]